MVFDRMALCLCSVAVFIIFRLRRASSDGEAEVFVVVHLILLGWCLCSLLFMKLLWEEGGHFGLYLLIVVIFYCFSHFLLVSTVFLLGVCFYSICCFLLFCVLFIW
jgi:hypothetical protein